MFNTSNTSQKTVINTPAVGIIQRSNPKSFFKRFHYKSEISDSFFSDEPKLNGKKITILQVMLIDGGYLLIETIFNDDF